MFKEFLSYFVAIWTFPNIMFSFAVFSGMCWVFAYIAADMGEYESSKNFQRIATMYSVMFVIGLILKG